MNLAAIGLDTFLIESIKEYLTRIDQVYLIDAFKDPIEAIDLFSAKERVDLIVIDLSNSIPRDIKLINKFSDWTKILLISSVADNYTSAGVFSNEIFTLSKPFTFDEFLRVVDSIKSITESEVPVGNSFDFDFFYLKGGLKNSFHLLSKRNVLFIEAMNNYVVFYFNDPGTQLVKSMITYTSLKQIEEVLIGLPFLRVSRSYIVALGYIHKVDGNIITLVNGKQIGIGATYKNVFQTHIKNNLLF